jgi:hypothetical protein
VYANDINPHISWLVDMEKVPQSSVEVVGHVKAAIGHSSDTYVFVVTARAQTYDRASYVRGFRSENFTGLRIMVISSSNWPGCIVIILIRFRSSVGYTVRLFALWSMIECSLETNPRNFSGAISSSWIKLG